MSLLFYSLYATHNISFMDYGWDFTIKTPSDSSIDSSCGSFDVCPISTMSHVRKVSPPGSRLSEGGSTRDDLVSPHHARSVGMATRSVTSGSRRSLGGQPPKSPDKRRRIENTTAGVQSISDQTETGGPGEDEEFPGDTAVEASFWSEISSQLLDSFDGTTDMGDDAEPDAKPEAQHVIGTEKEVVDVFDGDDESSFKEGWNGGEYVPDSGRGDANTLNMIAREINYRCDGAVYDDGEREKLENLTSNSKKYHDRVESVSKRLLDTATTMCGPKIASLSSSVYTNPTGGTVPMLYHMISGDRTEAKKIIINQIMVQCVLTWRLTRKHRDKKAGDHAESTTWDQWLKLLQSKFVQQNVNFSLKKDFFGKGEFHAVLEKAWKEEKRKNKDFGTGRYAAWFDEDMEDKILGAIESELIDLDDREHLQWVVFWLVGSSLLLRGGSEAHDRKWTEFEFETFTEANKNVEAYVRLTITTGSKFMNATVRGTSCCLFCCLIYSTSNEFLFGNRGWQGTAFQTNRISCTTKQYDLCREAAWQIEERKSAVVSQEPVCLCNGQWEESEQEFKSDESVWKEAWDRELQVDDSTWQQEVWCNKGS